MPVTITVPEWFATYLEVNLLPLEIEWLTSPEYPGEDGERLAKDLEQVQEALAGAKE